jgi:hypothetical protein
MRRHYRPVFLPTAGNPARNTARRKAAAFVSIKEKEKEKKTEKRPA